MKRGIFLSIILGLCLITCIPQVMAQKQSRMEKLLRYLNDNDPTNGRRTAKSWMMRRKLITLKNWHYWMCSTNYGMNIANRLPQTISDVTGKLSKEIFPRFVTKKKYSFPMYGTELNSRLSTSWKARRTRFLSAGQ